MLAVAPAVVALLGLSIAPIAVRVSLAEDPGNVAGAADAVRIAILLAVACGTIAATGAAVVLRRSIAATVDGLRAATSAIACGDFEHRIECDRGDEIGGLASAIDAMAERLHALDAARHRTLACVSHELRTPLTILRGHAFTLGRNETDPFRCDRWKLIDGEAARLGVLIDDLIEVASSHAGGLRLERSECDLVSVCRCTVQRFRAAATERGVTVNVSGMARDRLVLCDPTRVEQVLTNLVANAIRHADVGSTIDVELRASGRMERSLIVRNVGVAIALEDRERIFEPFAQVGDRVGRAGLGLAVARAIAIAHGGSLELVVGSDDPRQVEFRCTIPAGATSRDAMHGTREHRADLDASGRRPAGSRRDRRSIPRIAPSSEAVG